MDEDPSVALNKLTAALNGIEAGLVSLTSVPLDETRGALPSLDRAKLDVLLAYTINDLIWMYLRTRGVEPDTHDVTRELDRIKTYYAKIKDVESPPTRVPIDKGAAHRLITGSIPRAQRLPATSGEGLARAQAEAGAADDGPSMLSRFQFVQEGAEKVIPGAADDEMSGSGDNGGMDEDVVEDSAPAGQDEAQALLADVDGESEAPLSEQAPMPEQKKAKKGGAKRAKRKRAEDG
ncbi:hypothetical protein Q5752_003501 [Cryptotrichosporon argae]